MPVLSHLPAYLKHREFSNKESMADSINFATWTSVYYMAHPCSYSLNSHPVLMSYPLSILLVMGSWDDFITVWRSCDLRVVNLPELWIDTQEAMIQQPVGINNGTSEAFDDVAYHWGKRTKSIFTRPMPKRLGSSLWHPFSLMQYVSGCLK